MVRRRRRYWSAEGIRILGDNNGIGQEAHFAEGFDKAQDLSVVGKAGIPADFIFFNGRRADDQ